MHHIYTHAYICEIQWNYKYIYINILQETRNGDLMHMAMLTSCSQPPTAPTANCRLPANLMRVSYRALCGVPEKDGYLETCPRHQLESEASDGQLTCFRNGHQQRGWRRLFYVIGLILSGSELPLSLMRGLPFTDYSTTPCAGADAILTELSRS